MTQDPMVSALQGPQDPTMSALFPPRPLTSIDLLMHGRERLKDPNNPAYDPGNTFKVVPPGTPTPPPPWGGGGRITQGGQDPMAALFSHPAQHLQHMAGDVIPFPLDPRIADQRRIMNEDFMQNMYQQHGQHGLDQYRRMWPAAPVELGPGAAK
jgi:hypothetical protein